jgi:hypothetical protein
VFVIKGAGVPCREILWSGNFNLFSTNSKFTTSIDIMTKAKGCEKRERSEIVVKLSVEKLK